MTVPSDPVLPALPLHERIRQEIEGRIMAGDLRPGERLPSELELMAHYGCARMTVNKALSRLSESGLLERKVNSMAEALELITAVRERFRSAYAHMVDQVLQRRLPVAVCTIYEARPGVCRKYPDSNRCGYYEFLKFEREQQGDEEMVALT